jgi:hypothetical protein
MEIFYEEAYEECMVKEDLEGSTRTRTKWN